MRGRSWLAVLMLCGSLWPAMAAQTPKGGSLDARVTSVTYQENNVVQVFATYGISTMIIFDEDEKFETISLGDTESWQVVPVEKGNILFVKPIAKDVVTNMNVVTDKRIYYLELHDFAPEAGRKVFGIRFHYPEKNLNAALRQEAEQRAAWPNISGIDKANVNIDYSFSGDARFQTAMTLRRDGWFRRKGKILGRFGRQILRVDDDRHHLIIGPTRSGKGACYVVPNALSHEGSMIVTDLKGEIFNSTAGYRKSKGSQVFLFAPGSERSHRYNPLDFIRTDRGDRTTDIQNIAAILVPEVNESENSIWQATAQQVIAGAISYINESVYYKGHRTLGEVTSFFNSGVNLQAMMTLIKEREPYLSRFTIETFNAYIALSERTAASALLDIQKALRPFRNERVVAATSVTDMDLRALKRRPISIYLAPNVTDITLLRPLLALFVQQTLDTLMLEHAERSVPVYFLLDEFRQLKKMSEITTKLPYVAGYNVKMAFVIQDLKNLDEIYGETSRHSLMGNCGYQLVLGANDQVTAEAVSKGLGKRTVRYKTESRTIELMGLHRRTKVEQLRERDLMMPQEVRQMPGDKMVILAEGQGPIFADKLRFFRTAPFREMERFSQIHLPDVPATEFLPQRPVPATTAGYVGEHTDASNPEKLKAGPENVANLPGRRSAVTSNAHAGEHDGQTSMPSVRTASARRRSGSATPNSLNTDFAKAAKRLKTLAKAANKPGSPRSKSGNWSLIFDAAIPDELEIAEAEAV